MPEVVGRIKKRLRKKSKKTVSRRKIRAVWREFIDIMVIEPLIEKGKVMVDKQLQLEIVGRRLVDDKRKMNLLTKGLMLKRGKGIVEAEKLNNARKGFTYRIAMKEERFKEGVLMFDADKRIVKAVCDSLNNTNRYYRIENVN